MNLTQQTTLLHITEVLEITLEPLLIQLHTVERDPRAFSRCFLVLVVVDLVPGVHSTSASQPAALRSRRKGRT